MRKYLYAGAVAGSFLLLGAAPASADVQPAPASAQPAAGGLGGLLEPTNGMQLGSPLGGNPLLNVDPGDNSVLTPLDAAPPARTGIGQARDRAGVPSQPGADVPRNAEGLPLPGGLPTSGLPTTGLPVGGLPTAGLPTAGLLGGGLPIAGGLLPNGRSPLGGIAANQESGLLGGGVPLLGGLGGLLPGSSARTLPALSGLPAGGTAVPAGDQPGPAQPDQTTPDQTAPDQTGSTQTAPDAADPAIANDHRLHEEPTDTEGKDDTRQFSAGRPVAGADPEFD